MPAELPAIDACYLVESKANAPCHGNRKSPERQAKEAGDQKIKESWPRPDVPL